ncbi:MAG: DUF1993 domain-containing protein [Myxococcota bacterium]
MDDFGNAVQAGLVGALETMKGLLDQAEAHAVEREDDVTTLLHAQLYSDMFPLWRQVPQACNVARRCVDRLTGKPIKDPPRPVAELAALRAQLDETIAYVRACDASTVAATEGEVLIAKLAKQPVRLTGRTYFGNFAMPNLLFHVVTAYNILRSRGVKVGKHAYLRPLIDAGAPVASEDSA